MSKAGMLEIDCDYQTLVVVIIIMAQLFLFKMVEQLSFH